MLTFIFVFIGTVIGVCFHEYGHAIVAYKGGDYTVKEKGYLDFNPLSYAHPLTTFGLPILFLVMGGIPLPGGAVYIREDLLPNRAWRVAVSLAGPAGTLVFIGIISIPFLLGWHVDKGNLNLHPDNALWSAWAFLVYIEIACLYLNLIPIPPLDGFHVLSEYVMDRETKHNIVINYGIFGFFFLYMILASEAVGIPFWGLVDDTAELFGVPRDLFLNGYRDFRFWKQ